MKNFSEMIFEKHKKLLLIVLAIASLIVGWIYYSQKQNELICLRRIEYRGNGSTGLYIIKNGESLPYFKTQNEAMNYCLKVLI